MENQTMESALVRRSVRRTLLSMALPMLAGTFAMNAYNLTDTWFVSRLGTIPLAAMGFTFPVVMLLTCIAGGIGNGVTTLASHALGRQAHTDAARVVTHGLLLMMLAAVGLSVAGYFGIHALFSRMGADMTTLPMVEAYMRIWFIGACLMAAPMVGNGILIASGNSRQAARVMLMGPIVNTILDPIMIFGFAGFPAMGIRGAALATVIAQAVAAGRLFWLLHKRHRLLVFGRWEISEYCATFRRIMEFAVPAILSMIMMPVSAGIITRLLGRFGYQAVAAAGAAGRIEMFAFMVPMALGISLTPFVSQNYGAGRLDRIGEALGMSIRFAIGYGALMAVLFCLGAPWLAAIFTRDAEVAAVIVAYIRIISFGYGMMEAHRYCGFFFTGIHRPATATMLNAVRVLALLIPLAYLGAWLGGVRGIFAARLITDVTAGVIGILCVWRAMRAAR